MAVILLTAALAGIAWMGRHPLRLIWRTRWLLLILVSGYGFSLPGEAAWPMMGEWSPSWSGLALGAARALHLMVLLLWLEVLVLSLSGEQMLSGLHGLMTPFAWLGVDVRRLALRLALTLQAIARLEEGQAHAGQEGAPGGHGNLRRLFDPVPEEGAPECVVLTHYPIRRRDVWIPILVLAGFGALVWTGGWK